MIPATVEEIEEEIRSKTAEQLYDLMWDALDYMQSSNTRDKFYCIALALGYDYNENDNGGRDWFCR